MDRDPTAAECAHLTRDGYLVVREFFPLSRIADVLRWTAELAAAPEVPGRHWAYHEDSVTEAGRRVLQRIENFCAFHQEFDQLIRDGALARWASVLMGGSVVLFKDKINFKMPGGGGFKAHQDQQAGWSVYAPIFITAMVTLDRATLENGCLEIGTRRNGEALIGAEWSPLDAEGLTLQAVPTSKPNRTNAPRRILYLTYNLASAGDHRDRYYADKHAAFPPDIERQDGKTYVFRV
jgi:hypothetical protein